METIRGKGREGFQRHKVIRMCSSLRACGTLLRDIASKGFGAKLFLEQIPEAVAITDVMNAVAEKSQDPLFCACAFVLLRGIQGTHGEPLALRLIQSKCGHKES